MWSDGMGEKKHSEMVWSCKDEGHSAYENLYLMKIGGPNRKGRPLEDGKIG